MVEWHHQLNEREFEQAPGVGDGQGKYQSQLPFPSPGDLPDPGIKLRSPALQADSLPCEPPGKNENQSIKNKVIFNVILCRGKLFDNQR